MIDNVYLLICNDTVLGVYNYPSNARNAMNKIMNEKNHGEWIRIRDGRYCQKNGSIARLEVITQPILDSNN